MDFQQIRDFVNPAVAQATGLQEVDNLQMPVPVAYVPVQLVIDGALSLTSENPVQNKVIAVAIQNLDGRITAVEGQFAEGVTEAVNNWLAAHPEATTTVQDGAITYAKLDTNLRGEVDQISELKSAFNGVSDFTDDKNLYDLLISDGIGWIRNSDGFFSSLYDYKYKEYICNTIEGVYIKRANISGDATSVIHFFDKDKQYLGHYLEGSTTEKVYTDVYVSVPDDARYLFIVCSDYCEFSLHQSNAYYFRVLDKSISGIFKQADSLLSGNGWVNKSTGVLDTVHVYDYKYKKIAYDSAKQYILKNASISGQYASLINYYDSNDAFIGYDYDLVRKPFGIRHYDMIMIEPPENTAYFIVVYDTSTGDTADVLIPSDVGEHTHWTGKNILWLGTSIPATPYENGKAYPQIVGNNIGANVTNNAISGSCARKRFDPNNLSEMHNLDFTWDMRSLVTSNSDIDDIIANWSTYKACFDNAPDTLSDSQISMLRVNSYENRIDPYLDGNTDLIVFDHGRNDYPKMINENDLFDKTTFVGAMNTLIKHIYEANPRQRICMIAHYENQEFAPVVEYQEYVANYWSIPLFRLDKMLGWSNRQITTKHDWNDGVFEATSDNHTMVVHHAWLKDNLHPYMDSTGEATKLIASAITGWIKNIV